MNFIREMVSQKKIRFKNNDFNLDLSYITPRIIAMAYPASGVESLYRNKMHDVKEFLDTRHPGKYYVINTSSRKYDYSNFHNRVIDIDWPNHHPCRFYYFAKLVLETAKLLIDSDPDTVIVVHCLGGKGRTGSLIGCLLSLSGVIPRILDANAFYKEKRGVNVTYPSQIRYMIQFRYYFLFGKSVIDNSEKTLTSVSIKSSHEGFFEKSIFNLTFADYKNKNKIIYERSFEALFEKQFPKVETEDSSGAHLGCWVGFSDWDSRRGGINRRETASATELDRPENSKPGGPQIGRRIRRRKRRRGTRAQNQPFGQPATVFRERVMQKHQQNHKLG